MGALSRAMTLALSVGLVGCTFTSPPSLPATPIGVAPATVAAPTLAVTPLPADHGWLNLTIRWPDLEAGYNVALLPTTTQAIAVWVKKNGVTLGEPTIISRQPGATKATASIRVEAATNLSVEIKAYREAAPDLATAVPIAQNAGVTSVVRSKVTPLAITLNPINVPSVSAFNQNLGRVGDTVTVTGTNFGSGTVPIPTVTFNGVAATSVTRHSDTSLTVVVPNGATSGYVVVKADGVESDSPATYWVLSTFEISPPVKESWDTSPATSRMVRYGQPLALNEQHFWAWKNLDDQLTAKYGNPPLPTWSTTNPAAGSLDGNGLFTAGAAYATASITARLGPLVSNAIEVRAVGVNGVSLSASSLTLNAMPETGSPDPGYVTTGTLTATVDTSAPFNNGVTWSSSDTGRVTVSEGVVQTMPGAPEGTAIITATSVDDPNKKATASVSVTILGDLELGIE